MIWNRFYVDQHPTTPAGGFLGVSDLKFESNGWFCNTNRRKSYSSQPVTKNSVVSRIKLADC